MAWDGAGNFNRLYNWQNDAANGINITASRMDGEDTGFASSGFGNCLTRDNQGKPTGALTWNVSFTVSALTATTGAFSGLLSANAGATVSGGAFNSRGIADNATSTILNLASTGVAATIAGNNGTHSHKIADSATALFNAGYLEVPQNLQNATYTTVAADSGKHLYHTSGSAHTWTIDSQANVPLNIGTTLTFINNGTGVVTIAITSDSLIQSPGGATGSRSLAQYGRATAIKVTSTQWIIAGTGLT